MTTFFVSYMWIHILMSEDCEAESLSSEVMSPQLLHVDSFDLSLSFH